MPSTRDIRRRIKSVRNTAQITKAMQMVAAAKMRRAQQAALSGRPYAALMNEVLAEAASRMTGFTHPFLEARPVKQRAVILISTDRGLCGALNSNLLRETAKFDRSTTTYLTAGRKASQFVVRTKRPLAAEFTYKDTPQFAEARAISKFAQDLFLKREVDAVDILFTSFISTLDQRPQALPFLPVQKIRPVTAGIHSHGDAKDLPGGAEAPFFFEPDEETVLEQLLPHSLNFRIYQILLEAKASEHSARMVAMKNATDNAHQLIKDLTLEYNKLRQSNITKELLEIASAQMAVG
jgi:F-type H+-transporting ATPase subunit gamma